MSDKDVIVSISILVIDHLQYSVFVLPSISYSLWPFPLFPPLRKEPGDEARAHRKSMRHEDEATNT